MNELKRAALSVRPSSIHGWGVFAEEDMSPGDLIEQCYLLVCDGFSEKLTDYCFYLRDMKDKDLFGMPLGFGSIYNHADTPNAEYKIDEEHSVLIFSAKSSIKAGDEIFVSYGPTWFSTRMITPIQASFSFRAKRFFTANQRLLRVVLVTTALILFAMLMKDTAATSSYIL